MGSGEKSRRSSWRKGHWILVLQDEDYQLIKAPSSQFPSPSTRSFPLEGLVYPARLPVLFTTHRPEDKTKGLAVVIDARKQPLHPVLVNALEATQVSERWTASA